MGVATVEERQPSFLPGRSVLITCEVDRTTAFATGFWDTSLYARMDGEPIR
ncbi:MAG TPA: hypothetical protein VMU39_14025 [Solirubrobacteraceae bacterium]|nr:hypothetical protein [Solirubrobacteraceae bacterium]